MKESLKLIFSDWDGTLTHGQELGPIFFKILHLLKAHQIPLVIVTGRSKSWAHFLLSHIPYFDYVISEGGGVLSTKDTDGSGHNLYDHLMVDEIEVRRLAAFTEALVKRFPGVGLSADSFGRQTDRAIELSYIKEDYNRALEIEHYLKEENINFSTSNVHLNFWCGEISKYKAVTHFLDKYSELSADSCLYFGDSLNDQSMFRHFKNSVGVSNIHEVFDQLSWEPAIVLEGKENEGPYGVYNHLSSVLK